MQQEINLLKGRAIATLVKDRNLQFYVLSIYLRPCERKQNLEEILQSWRNTVKQSSHVFIAGDFNNVDQQFPELWNRFLLTFGCHDVNPKLPTYFFQGGESALDRCLIPDSYVSAAKLHPCVYTVPSHIANGHEILKMKLNVRPTVISNPLYPKHLTIPSGVFIPGKDGTPVKSTSALQELIRLLHREHDRLFQHVYSGINSTPSNNDHNYLAEGCSSYEANLTHAATGVSIYSKDMCPGYLGSHLTIASCFWSWWRTQPAPKVHPDIRPYVRARKYLRTNAQSVNVPKDIVEDLILASRKAIIQDAHSFFFSNGCYALPTLLIHQMLEVIETCIEGIPFVPNDEANSQARGLGNMVAFWERMRNICPKVNIYHGPILTREGEQCITDKDLDLAMLATREFWFESPPSADNAWDNVLQEYNNCDPWQDIPIPPRSTFYTTLLHTKDSAPGPDGIPYSAWRLLPEVTVDALLSYFYDIVNGTALPPLQVGVWIPKAKSGPTADHFRPLGMPNTIDRLIDGTIASHVMSYTAHLLHPSQAVMSCFKEPQKAVTAIQTILDSSSSACALLADLSKAFERVNPYWILELLRIRQAPRWLVSYTKFVLFNRRVTQKVQGRLLPSRVILQGVDMGRSFSVYLFCLAMDPLFVYLNRIPGVITVQGYVDDTTIIGNAQDPDWLLTVAECYEDLASAGFVMDQHSCFRGCITTLNKFPPRCCSAAFLNAHWPSLSDSRQYATIWEALQNIGRPGYNVAICRKGIFPNEDNSPDAYEQGSSIISVLSYEQAQDFIAGKSLHLIGAFAKGKCNCKSKTHVITNYKMRPHGVTCLERSGFGLQSLVGKAPALGLALAGRWVFDEHGSYQYYQQASGIEEYVATPFKKLHDRLKSFQQPTLSIVSRCIGFNTFILSVMPYTMSFFGLNTKELNRLRQTAVGFILKRHWIAAEILPYILRYLKIAPMLDPGLSALVAALGLYLREGNPVEELTSEVQHANCNRRQLSIVKELIDMWAPFVNFAEIFEAVSRPAKSCHARLLSVKNVVITAMVREARAQLRTKVAREGWSGGISFKWVEDVAGLKKTWCNPISRYTLLRWAVNQDDDVWLSMRGTRHQQLCGHCQQPADSFPYGFYHPPLCETCIRESNTTAWSLSAHHNRLLQSYLATIDVQQAEDSDSCLATQAANESVCRACGCGDNTIGHWTRWCPIPLIAAHAILRPENRQTTLNSIAILSPRNTAICTLILASFRRLLRQEGAFLHQNKADAKSCGWWIQQLHLEVAKDAHLELNVPFPKALQSNPACTLDISKIDLQRVLPFTYDTLHAPPMVAVATTDIQVGEQVASLPLDSLYTAALNVLINAPIGRPKNVDLQLHYCRCGKYHVRVLALSSILGSDMLVPTGFGQPKLMAQFDGSAHRSRHIGGAGAALFQVDSTGITLLDWGSQALPKCIDNIIAEGKGACLAITLYERYVEHCLQHKILPFPVDTIQGDIKSLLQHLDFRSRFRRLDMVGIVDQFHRKRSRLAPHSITEYRPREANVIADHLAGEGSSYLMQLLGEGEDDLGDNPEDFPIVTDPPYELLLRENAVIAGPHQGGKVVLILSEQISCDYYWITKCAAWKGGQHKRYIAEMALASQKGTKPLIVEYVSTAVDGEGRLYARHSSAQQLPRLVRTIFYGNTHKEIDISGAHYELIRLGARSNLMPIGLLREALSRSFAEDHPDISFKDDIQKDVKIFPILVINTGSLAACSAMASKGYTIKSWIKLWAEELVLARNCVTEVLFPLLRPDLPTTYRNRHFHSAETLETLFMRQVLQEVQQRCFAVSIIWLHDGFWICSSVRDDIIREAEQNALKSLFPDSCQEERILRITSLSEEVETAKDILAAVKPSILFPHCGQSKRRAPKFTREFPKAKFSSRQVAKRKATTYFARIAKRLRA